MHKFESPLALLPRYSRSTTARVLIAVSVAAIGVGCESELNTTTNQVVDVVTGTDAAATDAAEGSDVIADALTDESDAPLRVDGEAGSSDVREEDDVPPSDANKNLDTLGPGPDVPKYEPPIKPPFKCTADADCGKGYGVCAPETCNIQTGACEIGKAADGTACESAGICGSTGVCKGGACVAGNACSPKQCEPIEIGCGQTKVIDLTAVSASLFTQYPEACAWGDSFPGPEQIFKVVVSKPQVVSITLAEDATATASMIAIGQPTAGLCNPYNCYSFSGYEGALSLPAFDGKPAVFILDTTTASMPIEIKVECADVPQVCGDGTCDSTETCGNCQKDCGKCASATCGDGTCAADESCTTCDKDCGACPAHCAESSTPGCTGCDAGIEQCVCAQDSYCCSNSWDSYCAQQAVEDCGAAPCPLDTVCGDDQCAWGTETAQNCPNDCQSSYCGDMICASTETCTDCPGDCGFCPEETIPPACGNGKCEEDSAESCATCPQDCGACSAACGSWTGSYKGGCDGCACEAAVCAEDDYCCTDYWGSWCDDLCEEALQLKCPTLSCGDGICMTGEQCDSCSEDCGACTCGDGKCEGYEDEYSCDQDCKAVCGDYVCGGDETCSTCAADCGPCTCGDQFCAKGESSTECPWDCKHVCDTYCGGSTGLGCYCDSLCVEYGDCCNADGTGTASTCSGSSCESCNGL